jgi:hypothetical protein
MNSNIKYCGRVLGCGSHKIIGLVEDAIIRIGRYYYFSINLLVVEQLLKSNLFIIGYDFLCNHKSVIDCSNGSLYFKSIDKTISCISDNKSARLTNTFIAPINWFCLLSEKLISRIKFWKLVFCKTFLTIFLFIDRPLIDI